MNRVLRAINHGGRGEWISHSEALRYSHLRAELFRRVVEKLKAIGAIEYSKRTEKGKTKATTYYRGLIDRVPIRNW